MKVKQTKSKYNYILGENLQLIDKWLISLIHKELKLITKKKANNPVPH